MLSVLKEKDQVVMLKDLIKVVAKSVIEDKENK